VKILSPCLVAVMVPFLVHHNQLLHRELSRRASHCWKTSIWHL